MKKFKQMIKASFVSVLASIFLVGCNEQDHYRVNLEPQTVETGGEFVSGTANILWVFDTSGSMGVHNDNVRRNARAFTDVLNELDLDFTMAVTISHDFDIRNNDFSKVGQFAGTPAVLDSSVPNWEQAFRNRIPSRSSSGGREQIFLPLYEIFSPERVQNGDTADFITPGGHLIIVIVTDTDDQSEVFDGFSDPQKMAMSRISQYYKKENIAYFGILCLNNVDCESDWNRNIVGNRLHRFSKAVPGELFSIEKKDYKPYLKKMGEYVASILSRYILEDLPIIETLEVYVNGKAVPNSLTEGWSYDIGENAIYFHGRTFTPRNDDRLEVKYKPLMYGGRTSLNQ